MNNALLREISYWLWDYSMLATGLLVLVVTLRLLIRQPARRIAVHWATALGLAALALLCLMPNWSVVNLTSKPELPPSFADHEPFGPIYEVTVHPPTEADLAMFKLPDYPAPGTFPNDNLLPDGSSVSMMDGSLLLPKVIVAGSLLSLCWLFFGFIRVSELCARAEPAPSKVQAMLSALAGPETSPGLGILDALPVAAAVGLLRPKILLPRKLVALDDSEQLQSVLAHELAHVRHRDLWLLALLRGLRLLLWPNPLYWLWRRSVRLDQETLADAAAAEVTDRGRYAEQLVAWARIATDSRTPRLASSVGLWESPSQLRRRVAVLLDEKLTVLRACSRRWRVGSAALLLLVAVGLSLVTLQPANEVAAEVKESETLEPTGNATSEKEESLSHQSFQEYFSELKLAGVLREVSPDAVRYGSKAAVQLRSVAAYRFEPANFLKQLEPYFDAKAGYRRALESVLEGFEKDPFGPQVNVQRDFLDHLGGELLIVGKAEDSGHSSTWGLAISTRDSSIHRRQLENCIASVMLADQHATLQRVDQWRVWQVAESDSFVALADSHLLIANELSLLKSMLEQFAASGLTAGSLELAQATPKQATPSQSNERLIALLEKSVENYAKTLEMVETWNAEGVAAGSGTDVLLAKFQWLQARIALAKAKQQTGLVSELHQAAVETAKQRVQLVQLRYDSGNETLESVLAAQRLQTEAEIAQLEAEQAAATPSNADQSTLQLEGNSELPSDLSIESDIFKAALDETSGNAFALVATDGLVTVEATSEEKPSRPPTRMAEEQVTQTHSPADWPKQLTGIVVDDRDQPVAGAALTLTLQKIHQFGIGRWDETVAKLETLSDRNGRYEMDLAEFPELRHRPFSLSLSAVAEGHADVCTWNWYSGNKETIVSGAVFDLVRMPRGRIVTGRCVDPQGRPVAGAVIRGVVDYGNHWMQEAIQADAQGEFQLALAKQGAAQLWIYSDRWAPKHVPVPSETTSLGDITLESGTVVVGTVSNPDGSPCEDCVVMAEGAYGGNMDRIGFNVELAAKTNSQGEYRLPPLKGEFKLLLAQAAEKKNKPGEQYLVSAAAPPPVIPQRVELDGTQSELRVELRGQATITLSGAVRWADASPVEGCEMKYASRGGEWLGRTLTDAQGKYTLTIPKDMPDVVLFAFGARDRNGEWQTPYTAENMPVKQAGAIQTVRVEESLDQDRKGYDWVLRAQGPKSEDKQSEAAQTSKSSGKSEATESPDAEPTGELTLTPTGALVGLVPGSAKKPNVSNKLTLVCRAQDGQPQAGLEATLYRLSRVSGEQTQVKSARTDGEGIVVFNAILPPDVLAEQQRRIEERDHPPAPETYYAAVVRGEGLANEVSLLTEFQLALNYERRVLTMRPAATLRGRVVAPDGQPVAGASVAVGSQANLFALGGVNSTTTDNDGRFEFSKLRSFDVANAAQYGLNEWATFVAVGDTSPPLPPRRNIDPLTSALVVRHPDFATITMIGGNIPGDVEIKLQPAGSLQGRVVTTTGRPAPNIPIQIVGRKQQLASQDDPLAILETLLMPYSALTHTDSEGNYRFDHLAANKYDVAPQADSTDISRADWIGLGKANNTVAAGKTTAVGDIEIGPGGILLGQLLDADTGEPPVVTQGDATLTVAYIAEQNRSSTLNEVFTTSTIPMAEDGSFQAKAPAGEFRVLVFGPQDNTLEPPSNVFRTADHADRSGPAIQFRHREARKVEIQVYSAERARRQREFYQKALRLLEQDQYSQASEKLLAGIEQFPEAKHEYLWALGECYRQNGQWAEAIDTYEKLVSTDRDAAVAYQAHLMLNFADLLATVPVKQLRDGKRAAQSVQRILDISSGPSAPDWLSRPDFRASALNILAAAQAESGDFDAAIKSQQEALQLAPHQAFKFEKRLRLYQQGKPYHREEPAR